MLKPYYKDDYTTLYHCDNRKVLRELAIDTLISDVPYGCKHKTDNRRFSGGENSPRYVYTPIANDKTGVNLKPLLKYRRVVLFGANHYSLPSGTLLIWDKRTPNGNKNVMSDAEVAWLNEGGGCYIFSHAWDGFNRASERHTAYHPTQKPVALMRWVIGKAKPRGLICDPYCGSGSVLIAAKELGLHAVGIEIEREYCDTTAERLSRTQTMLPEIASSPINFSFI